MFQIIFNELSAAEMSALPKTLQLDLLAEFQILPTELDNLDASKFGVIEREGKKLYRYRAKDYRIYFEKAGGGRHRPSRAPQEHVSRFPLPQQTPDGGRRSTRESA
jgi:mRNA-degrading endonuclease RelE of RelBE toxin-antitoxin system